MQNRFSKKSEEKTQSYPSLNRFFIRRPSLVEYKSLCDLDTLLGKVVEFLDIRSTHSLALHSFNAIPLLRLSAKLTTSPEHLDTLIQPILSRASYEKKQCKASTKLASLRTQLESLNINPEELGKCFISSLLIANTMGLIMLFGSANYFKIDLFSPHIFPLSSAAIFVLSMLTTLLTLQGFSITTKKLATYYDATMARSINRVAQKDLNLLNNIFRNDPRLSQATIELMDDEEEEKKPTPRSP